MKKSESNRLFNQELIKANEIYSRLKAGLDKRTVSAFRLKLNTVDHLSSVKKLVKDLTILKQASEIVMQASKPISTKSVKQSKQLKNKVNPLREYHITGLVNTEATYFYNNKKGKQSKTYYRDYPIGLKITARSKEEALKQFEEQAPDVYSSDPSNGEDSNVSKNIIGSGISSISVTSHDSGSSEGGSFMKSSEPVKYEYIPNDESHNNNNGFCVPDTFISIYKNQIKSINIQSFTDLCYHVRGEDKQKEETKQISLLDVGIEIDDEDEPKNKQWKLEDGVTPEMLCKICEHYDISHYAFDITKQFFLKYVSKNKNYDALVYYCVNGHMYWISCQKNAYKLIMQSKDVECKLKSFCIEFDKVEDKSFSDDRKIYENIPVAELINYKNCIIIYTQVNLNDDKEDEVIKKTNLNEELDDIIKTYNYVPKIKNQKYAVTQINFNKDDADVVLVIDPNDEAMMTYKDIMALCEKTKTKFTNQSFGQFINQLKEKFFDTKSIRHIFTSEERTKMFNDHPNCESCNKALKYKSFQIDHIMPLACGGTNEPDNLQILCKPCHFDKTRGEQENGYVKLSQTESSFNTTTKEIFNSSLNNSYAFVEKLIEFLPVTLANHVIFHYDINRCRKNMLFYSKYDYPLFTVMDEPQIYKGIKKAGLYYVETESYLPLRGHGWYSQPMIEYCLLNNIIKEDQIKYALYSSLTVPYNYYNEFINHLYSVLEDKSKLSVNTMIGMFKPKARENWTSILITDQANIAFHHYMDKKGCFISSRPIGDKTFYQVYNKYMTDKDETEATIYNQILELEAIELHKLMTIIREKNGIVLDVATDCVSCVFPDNINPFTVASDGINIEGYYYDELKTAPKYKLEEKEGRLKTERLSKYIRTEVYEHKPKQMTIFPDVQDNDFKPLVNLILDGKKSIHIDGRAGCGKSTLIKMLQNELNNRGIMFKSLAPTNKACRIINGETIHKFVASSNGKTIKEMDTKYIFIDEVSMMSEIFYKYFIVLKRMRPDITFIIGGDFAQLLPVKERIAHCDYKESIALFELCDGQRLQLTKCRRSDDKLFNMLLPENINKIKIEDFTHIYADRHISFTNKKRIQINKYMMDKTVKAMRGRKQTLKLNKLSYDDNSQDVELLSGMPIIARINSKSLNICNNEKFTIKEIKHTKNIIMIQDEDKLMEIPFELFQKLFYVAYCITCHKSQGESFDHPYTIHEFEKFDERMKYVALSRSTNIKFINIC